MKKRLIYLMMPILLIIGVFIGHYPWENLLIDFKSKVITPNLPTNITHFGLSELPEYSSKHYFFKIGFQDVTEYWSFVLPPKLAEAFILKSIKEMHTSKNNDPKEIPKFIIGMPKQEKWHQEYWFSSLDDLNEIYYRKYFFCGYSKKTNRIYLVNWND